MLTKKKYIYISYDSRTYLPDYVINIYEMVHDYIFDLGMSADDLCAVALHYVLLIYHNKDYTSWAKDWLKISTYRGPKYLSVCSAICEALEDEQDASLEENKIIEQKLTYADINQYHSKIKLANFKRHAANAAYMAAESVNALDSYLCNHIGDYIYSSITKDEASKKAIMCVVKSIGQAIVAINIKKSLKMDNKEWLPKLIRVVDIVSKKKNIKGTKEETNARIAEKSFRLLRKVMLRCISLTEGWSEGSKVQILMIVPLAITFG